MKLCCIYDKLRNTDRMTIRLDGFFGRAKGGGGSFPSTFQGLQSQTIVRIINSWKWKGIVLDTLANGILVN